MERKYKKGDWVYYKGNKRKIERVDSNLKATLPYKIDCGSYYVWVNEVEICDQLI